MQPSVKYTQKKKWGRGGMLQEGGDVCIIIADLHCRMAETNTNNVKQFYSN